MTRRNDWPFYPVDSTAPAFNSTALGNTAASYALESSGVREWDGPHSRAISVNSVVSGSYYVTLGRSSDVTSSTNGYLVTALERDIIHVEPMYTHIGLYSSSTQTVNVTLGYGRQ